MGFTASFGLFWKSFVGDRLNVKMATRRYLTKANGGRPFWNIRINPILHKSTSECASISRELDGKPVILAM